MLESASGAKSDDTHHPESSIRSITAQDPPPALPELCAQIHEKLHAFLNAEPRNERIRAVQAQSRISLGVIEEALRKYSEGELSLSYNGGKDCLVLLILYLSALHTHYTNPSSSAAPTTTNNSLNHTSPNHTSPNHIHRPHFPQTLRSVYIISPHPFRAVDDFVIASTHTYHLLLARYAKPMREAFTDYLADYPSTLAIFVGTRRTDPHGASLTHFDPTDRGWPAFMRIHPVIDWHYAEIWTFIMELGVEYCGLYDMGYTSLGGTTDTHPNPALAVKGVGNGGGEGRFRPAYELVEDGEERLGRDR